MSNKLKYLLRSAKNFSQKKICPYCKSTNSEVIDRKYIVTTLNECNNCHLYFRHPVDSIDFNAQFYQQEYEQKDGITTDMPSDEYLKKLTDSNFKGSGKDYSDKIAIIKEFIFRQKNSDKMSLVDYGANWGYAGFQFSQAGFVVQSYEISKIRAEFGKKLGINIFTHTKFLNGDVDVFFSSHVIEHLPDIKSMFETAQKLLKNDGLFIAYCPNGSEAYQKSNPASFHKHWGEVHPSSLNNKFFQKVFKDVPYLIGTRTSDIKKILSWDQESQLVLDLSGAELVVFAKIKHQRF